MGDVLLVDDAQFMRNLYRALLDETAATVVAGATNGVEGVGSYEQHQPDVVVMNIRMPVLDGIGATEQIVEYDPDATVVICSGNQQKEKMKAALEAGVADYLTKPFQQNSFVDAVTGPLD